MIVLRRLILGIALLLPLSGHAAITGTVVQCAGDHEGATASTTVGAGEGWASPTSGNILTAHFAIAGDGDDNTASLAGFTVVQNHHVTAGGFQAEGSTLWKVSDGTETSFSPALVTAPVNWSVVICEWDSTDLDTSGIDASGEDVTDVTTNVTSTSSGSATNTVADALVITSVYVYNNANWEPTSYSNGVQQSLFAGSASSRAGSRISSQVVASTGSQTEGFSTTDTGDEAYGNIIIFAGTADTDPPVYSVAPAVASKDATSVTLSGTATDASGPIDHYFAVYADGSTPTAANVKGAAGTGFITSSNDSDLNVTSGVAASVTSGATLTAATAYEGCMVAEDNLANLQATATCVGFTTDAAIANVPLLVQDAFTGTGTVAGRTPDVNEPGNTWSIVDIWSGQSAGTATLQSNTLELATQTAVVIDVGTADMVVDVDYVAEAGGNVGLPLRYVDSANWWKCQYVPDTNFLRLQKRVSDVTTNFDTQAFAFTASQSYRLTGYAHGDEIGCAIDGVPKVVVNDSALNTATKGGVSADADATGPRFDNLTVMQPFDAHGLSGDVSDGQNSFFFGEVIGTGNFYWLDPDDLPDQTNNDLKFYDGGDFYIDPETDLAGETQWGIELFDSDAPAILTFSHTHTTIETAPGTAPVFNNVDCSLKTAAYEVNVNPGPADISQCLTTMGVPAPTFTVTAGAVPTGRILDAQTGVLSGTPSTATGSPFSFTITATNATGSDTLDRVVTVTAQSGSEPTCDPLPDSTIEIPGSLSRDANDFCTGATDYTWQDLPTGMTGTGATASGTPTTDGDYTVILTASNTAGSVQEEWIITVLPQVAPTVVIAQIINGGDVLRWPMSEAVFAGIGGSGGATLTCDGGAVTPTYSSGTTAPLFTLSRTIGPDEICTTGYTQPTDGFEDAVGNDLATFSGTTAAFPTDCEGPTGYPIKYPILNVRSAAPTRTPYCIH